MTSFLVFILTHEPFVTFSLLCPAVEWQSVFAAYLASRQGQTELAHTSPLLWGWAPHPLTILNTDLPYLFWASGDRDGLEFFQVFSCHIKSFLVPNSQCYGACWLFFFSICYHLRNRTITARANLSYTRRQTFLHNTNTYTSQLFYWVLRNIFLSF